MPIRRSFYNLLARLLALTLSTSAMLPLGDVPLARLAPQAPANNTPQTLPFSQNWSNTGLITANDDWTNVPGIIGYRGDGLTAVTGTDPQTILADGTTTPVNVIANTVNTATLTGGIAEFELANPVVAFQGSGTADAPFLLLHLNTAGYTAIQVNYVLRDVDFTTDNAVQPVALHYRVGSSGNFTNVPAGYVADASNGPSAGRVTTLTVTLPAAADNQALVQVRWMTANAVGNDEWIGVDDIAVTGTPSGGNLPVVVTCGGTLTLIQGQGGTRQITARDTDGTVVSMAVTSVSPSPAPGTITMTNVIPAPGVGLTATGTLSVSAAVPAGTYSVQVTATNNDSPTPQTGTCSLTVTVIAVLKIGQVQGPIPDSLPNPFTYASPYVGQQVVVAGIVTDKMMTRSGATVYYHFYLQERPQDSDGDPLTADGVHVFIGSVPSFNGYTPVRGDSIVIQGMVTEYFNDTELTSPQLIVNNGNLGNVDTLVPVVEINPSGTVTQTGRMYERVEGMRVLIPAGAKVVSPAHLFASTNDSEIYVIRGDHPVALRANVFERYQYRALLRPGRRYHDDPRHRHLAGQRQR